MTLSDLRARGVEPDIRVGPLKSTLHLGIAAFLGAGLMAFPWFFDSGTYFRDDVEAQFAPTVTALGRSLASEGRLPLLTLQSWYGGNVIGEYQFGIFNPILLIIYYISTIFSTLNSAASFIAISLGAILGSGAHALARRLGLGVGLAHVATISIVGNNFVTYWFAASWVTGLASTTFLVWAMALLMRSNERRSSFVGAVAAVFLTVTSGFANGVLVLGVFTAVRQISLGLQKKLHAAFVTGLAAALGVMLAAVAIAPLAGMSSTAVREAPIMNTGFLVANLRDILTFSNPFHIGPLRNFDGRPQILIVPIFYAVWFALPFAALVNWRRVNWLDPSLRTLLGFTSVMLIATQGPSDLMWLRFPVKFLPYFHLGVILIALMVVQNGGFSESSSRRMVILAAVLGMATVSSLQSMPMLAAQHIAMALLIGFAAVVARNLHLRSPQKAAIGVASLTFLLAAGTRALVSGTLPVEYAVFAPWNAPREIAVIDRMSSVPTSYEFIAASAPPTDGRADNVAELPFGQLGLSQGRSLVNGYSPIGHAAFARIFCWIGARWPCPDAVPNLFRTESATGATFADLMRVDRIIIERGPHLDRIAGAIPDPWRVTSETPTSVTLERPLPNAALPGSVSWLSPGLRVEPLATPAATAEDLRVESRTEAPGTIVFARLAWPGYRATLDGRPIPVRAHEGIFVTVDLPPGSDGRVLRLTFVPAGLETGIAISLLAGLLVVVYVLVWPVGRGRSRAAAGG